MPLEWWWSSLFEQFFNFFILQDRKFWKETLVVQINGYKQLKSVSQSQSVSWRKNKLYVSILFLTYVCSSSLWPSLSSTAKTTRKKVNLNGSSSSYECGQNVECQIESTLWNIQSEEEEEEEESWTVPKIMEIFFLFCLDKN